MFLIIKISLEQKTLYFNIEGMYKKINLGKHTKSCLYIKHLKRGGLKL